MLKSITLFLVVSLLGCSRAACPLTGHLVMPHEGDTTKYVVCREGTALILGCDDGTTYNRLTKRCESSRYWSERAPTCSINQVETLYFPHETYCSMFYTCAHGVTSLEKCPEGLEYSQDLQSCDWPSPNGCFAHTTASPPTESTTEGITEIITDPTTERTTEIITDPTTKSTTEIITDPTTKSTTEIITYPTTEITSEWPTDSTPIDPPVKCPINGTDVTLLPHPTKCDTFYVCWDGIPTMMECFSGYEFDVAAGGCVLISDSGCTASKTSTTGTTTESTTVTSTDSTSVNPPVKCPSNGTITMFPHPTNCDMFYVCWEEIPTLMECYSGYEFDPEAGGCVLISDSGCTASKTTIRNTKLVTPTGPTPAFIPECDPDTLEITLIPHPTNCQVYYVCWGGTATSISCIYDYEFDVASGKCVPISSTGCTASKTSTLVWSTSTESSSSLADHSSPAADEPGSKELVVNMSTRNTLFSKLTRWLF